MEDKKYDPLSLSDAISEDIAEQKERNSFQFALLVAMNVGNYHVYGGTVPEAVKEKRRKANRVAKHSRKINRKKEK